MPVSSAPGPSTPLSASYTHHSPKPTASGPYILGVDEAGRGPVLGPLVYGVAYCPVSFQEEMEELGFAGTKHVRSVLKTLSQPSRTFRFKNSDAREQSGSA